MRMKRIYVGLVLFVLLGCFACSTVPKEVVELSYTVGQDTEAIHESYRTLIQTHFDDLRAQALSFLKSRWMPAYLGDFIKSGDLVALAKEPDPVKAYQGV